MDSNNSSSLQWNKVQWSIINVPRERRLQTLGCLLAVSMPWLLLWVNFLFLFYFSNFWLLLWLLYVAWVFVYDQRAPSTGTRMNLWVRRLPYWKYFRDYFPAELVKTADLDPNKSYIFGAHPHGIIGLSLWANFSNEYSGFRELYPGVDVRLGTLTTNFQIPLVREYNLAIGLADVSKPTIMSLLKKHISIIIVVGGAAESLNARPGNTELVLQGRKGFVKLALQTGSSLVPIYSFGENELYDQLPNPEGSAVRKFQEWTKSHLGWTLPIINGRGVWNYSYGLLPRRHHIMTVIGSPIDCPKIEEPSEEQVNEYHTKYIQSLSQLYEDFKEKANQRENELRIT